VSVSGQVVSAASFSQGFKFTLDDGSGRATLLMWHNVYDDSWDAPQLNIGAAVRATGKVGQYEGEWQIEPNFGGDVTVTTSGGNTAPPRAIGELASHVGEMAQINGVILRLESTSSAVKIFVGDETGEIVVFIWRTILDRIPNNVPLGEPGTRVRVNGRVENYRSNLELVPALPYDVEVEN
jgi:DNA/RNA endonuclease YhcR with UshA esterase domain